MFSNTLTANAKHTVPDCVNFSSPIQTELSLKPRRFLDFFVPFVESTSNFEHSEKKDDRHSYFISEITDCERLV